MLKVQEFEFNMLPVNTFVIYDETLEAAIIDPGCYFPGEAQQLKEFVETNRLTVKYILNTHLHFDHIFGNPDAEDMFGLRAKASSRDSQWLQEIGQRVGRFGIRYSRTVRPIMPENIIDEGDIIRFGNTEIEIFSVPGHSPGSLVFYSRKDGILFSGDALFQGSIGRTDFEDGDPAALPVAIREKLFTLPDSTAVYPGHGPATTIGMEKRYNPYIQA